MADVIGNPTIRAEFDGTALVKDAKAAGAKLKTTFEESNRSIEAAQRSSTKRIQGLISQINAEKPRRQMFELGQAIQHMGGVSKLTEGQVSRLRVQVNQLAAAGAKVPASLAGMTGGVNKLGAAFTSLATGGGARGALASLGPSGVLAAGGIGVATVAAVKLFNAVKALAAQAEEWQNVSEATGISVVSVQKLGDFLEDAGFSAGDLTLIMKKLQTEIATGGKEFEKYGISLSDIRKLAPEDQLRAIAAAVLAIEDPTNRAAAATEFFGKQGAVHLAALAGIATGAYTKLSALNLRQVAELKQVDDALDQAGRAWTNWGKRALLATIEAASGGGVARSAAALSGKRWQPNMSIGAFNALTDPKNNRFLDTSPLTLPLDPVAAARRKEQQEVIDKALTSQRDKQREIAELLEKQYQSARKLAFELIAGARRGPTSKFMGIDTITGSRGFGQGTMVGSRNYDFGIDAQGFVTWGNAAEEAERKTEKAAAATVDWQEKLANVAMKMHEFGGILGGVGAAIVSVVGAIGYLKQMGTSGGKFSFKTLRLNLKTEEGKQAAGEAGAAALGAAGSAMGNSVAGGTFRGASSGASIGNSLVPGWGAVVGGVIGGAVGFFKSSNTKLEAQKAGAILGKIVTDEQLKAFKEEAKAAGLSWEKYLREKKRLQDVAIAEEKRSNLEAGLGAAKTAAESLMARVDSGGLSAALAEAFRAIIDKVGVALLKSGLGILDGRLTGSKEFQAAQRTAADVAGVLGGMRQAGMIDNALLDASGAAAAEIQKQAVAAALAEGMSPEEAAKVGSAAIAPLLREQLNASLQSGRQLDQNTKDLLAEAERQGIIIAADPALESLDYQKKQLAVLEEIRDGKKPPVPGSPTPDEKPTPEDRRGPDESGARGLGPMITRDMGGGLGPLVQTHPNELLWVVPNVMRRGGIISAARGIYDDERERRGGDGLVVPGGSAGSETTTAAATTVAQQVLSELGPMLAKMRPVTVSTTIAPTYNEDPTSSKERREDLRRFEHENLKRILRSRDPETVYLMKRALDMG